MRFTPLTWDRRFLLTCWLPASALLPMICLVLAWNWYPRYSIYEHDISFLGHPRLNPTSWGFWSLGMAVSGIMLWPTAAWISHQMADLTAQQPAWRRKLVAIGSVSSRSSCLGLVALALIPQYPGYDLAHQIAGAVAFCGMYFAMMLFWCLPLWGSSLGSAKAGLVTLAAWWGPAGYLATQGFRFFAYGEMGRAITVPDESRWLRFSLWEWMLLVCATISPLVLVLVLPDRENASPERFIPAARPSEPQPAGQRD